MVSAVTASLLPDALPKFASELERCLREGGHHALADQINDLHIVDRCRCGDRFCATCYTMPQPRGSYSELGRHQTIQVAGFKKGMVILDVVDDRIACVEVLYRGDIRSELRRLFS